jgi:hypothetical protein
MGAVQVEPLAHLAELALRFSPDHTDKSKVQISPGSRAVSGRYFSMSFQNIYYKRVSVSHSYVLLQYHGFFPKKKKKELISID